MKIDLYMVYEYVTHTVFPIRFSQKKKKTIVNVLYPSFNHKN